MENKTKRMDKKNINKKKKSKRIKIVIVLLLIILLVVCLVIGYVFSMLGKVKQTNISKKKTDLGISATADALPDDITNFALFGVDRRDTNENGNSDSIMIASIDKIHKKIKLTSIMRDTKVTIDGLGTAKINAAYQKGAGQLAIKTLNQNFNLNIKDYIKVDFFGLEKIISSVGGLSINLTSDEVKYINAYILETSTLEKVKPIYITKPGLQLLSGKQAVAYARIRYTIGDDFKRTERQRLVLTLLLDKVQVGGVAKYPSFMNAMLPNIETSMSSTQLLAIGTSVFTSGISTLEQERFPADGYWTSQMIKGSDYLVPIPDLKTMADQINNYIYDDVKPVPKIG